MPISVPRHRRESTEFRANGKLTLAVQGRCTPAGQLDSLLSKDVIRAQLDREFCDPSEKISPTEQQRLVPAAKVLPTLRNVGVGGAVL